MAKPVVQQIISSISQILLGKQHQIELALTCILARGHLLIEDLPGMGKTTLSQALAAVLGLTYQRVQFTSDLLPADIIGVSIFNQTNASFEFKQGPVFSQLLLADEINRATPKTQSALLEAMEERQVTVDGKSWPLPQPFFVIATQNPSEQMGTFPLPESQLDRFLMRISLGYPDAEVEKELIKGKDRRAMIVDLQSVVSVDELVALQKKVTEIHASDAIIDYVQRLVAFSRYDASLGYGLSPRATLSLMQSARAYALVRGRDHVVPEDVQTVLEPVAGHRLQSSSDVTGHQGISVVEQMLESVDVINGKVL
ncbi:MAG: MoxR family ATPase [Ketobacteraceae bacterium]|nr:MoxR family ATPase [Ketobacteraceae bacterium]